MAYPGEQPGNWKRDARVAVTCALEGTPEGWAGFGRIVRWIYKDDLWGGSFFSVLLDGEENPRVILARHLNLLPEQK